MIEEKEVRMWHVNREVSLGDLVAIAVAVVAVVTSYMSLSARVTVVETMTTANTAQINGTVSDIKQELRRLSDRIERLMEQHIVTPTNGKK